MIKLFADEFKAHPPAKTKFLEKLLLSISSKIFLKYSS